MPRPEPFDNARQRGAIGPKFTRLAQVLERGGNALELRADPTALAPERLLVFEVRGAINAFANAIQRVPGLELVDEEELSADEEDKEPVAYLLMPDVEALRQLESLWRRWQRGQLVFGETPWRDVFQTLRDLRPWGPQDRVQPIDASQLAEEIEGRDEAELVRLEIELIFRVNAAAGARSEDEVRAAIVARGGRMVSRARIDDIAYHALLVDLPVWEVRQIIDQSIEGIAGLEPVMHIRPQSVATGIETADAEPAAVAAAGDAPLGEPILALLDGVPVAAHPLLARHLALDDAFDLEPGALVANRTHGTAMASLIVHGDRNRREAPLPRRVHVVPVLGDRDAFPEDRLVVDLIYLALMRMKTGDAPTAPNVILVNLSLGNRRRPFHGQLSAWARLLDRLAYRFGVLFLVSAGNSTDPFAVPDFISRAALEDANPRDRAVAVISALGAIVADRRLFAPAETVNGITVGACNEDAIEPAARTAARVNVDPFPDHRLANPSSTLGPGFARSVKPDILMPGSREHVMVVRNHDHIDVQPVGPSRAAGLKVAGPPTAGRENSETFTCGTSAATALATRTCHRIHDALEATYGDVFTGLTHHQRAVLLKALLVHPAHWPGESAALIREVLGPADGRQHVRQKDNIRRFLGFGWVDADEAVACAEDRATFWAAGTLMPERVVNVSVPIPQAIAGQARLHSLSATLAWFTPVSPGRKRYRTCRLKILEPAGLGDLAVRAHGDQPDSNQTNRGTLFTRCWRGDRAPVVGPDHSIVITIQRDPDQGGVVDDPIPFGLAISIAMPGAIGVYEQVRQRLQPQVRAGL
ncbi:S8 family peptidase [Sphingopyxis indica]|nr:S8 family peptidase [Sphingopyxis indica]